jgi:hypothetical protein
MAAGRNSALGALGRSLDLWGPDAPRIGPITCDNFSILGLAVSLRLVIVASVYTCPQLDFFTATTGSRAVNFVAVCLSIQGPRAAARLPIGTMSIPASAEALRRLLIHDWN